MDVAAEREEKIAEDEHNCLLSTSHTADDDDVKCSSYSHSKSASVDVASSMKDVRINENPQSKTSVFRRSSSSSKSHRRVVSWDSDSDEDDIGPPVPSTDSCEPHLSTHVDNNSDDDDEIGPPVPSAEMLPKVIQGDPHDEEIGPPLPETLASESKQEDSDYEKSYDDDDDDDADDDSEVVATSLFKVFVFFSINANATLNILIQLVLTSFLDFLLSIGIPIPDWFSQSRDLGLSIFYSGIPPGLWDLAENM